MSYIIYELVKQVDLVNVLYLSAQNEVISCIRCELLSLGNVPVL